jgi:hypothetical protein
MIRFAVRRGCSSTTLRNSVNELKFPEVSDVHSWLTEHSDLKFHKETEVNFTALLVRAVRNPTANKPQQKKRKHSILPFLQSKTQACSHWTYTANLLPILIHRTEIWTLRIQDKERLASIEIKFFGRTLSSPSLNTNVMKKFGRCESTINFRKIRRYKSNCIRRVTWPNSNMVANNYQF